MAGTLRTRSALDTLFADNTAGDISAQDLRDFLWSAPILLSRVNSAITTANLTATVNAHHVLDISGMTAQRDLVIPAGTDEGDTISFHLETAAPSTIGYELRLIGDTGVTLNLLGTDRTATADDRFCYYIKGESARLRWDATDSKWLLDGAGDGRIVGRASITNNGSTGTQAISANTLTTINSTVLDTTQYDNGGHVSGSKLYVRRDTEAIVVGHFTCAALSDGEVCDVRFQANTTTDLSLQRHHQGAASIPARNHVWAGPLSRGDYVEMRVQIGQAKDTLAGAHLNRLALAEVR